jgi:tol-pal system-associated acyl-CoA thioesterase
MNEVHYHPIQVYYEDTDHSGLVYHANYLKFMERAREHFIGIDHLLELGRRGVGYVVYRAEVTYREGARFGDALVVRTRGRSENGYRLLLEQDVFRAPGRAVPVAAVSGAEPVLPNGAKPMVAGRLDLVCVDGDGKLAPLPESIMARFGVPGADRLE